MIVVDTYVGGYFIPIWYERKHTGPYLLQQLKSAMQHSDGLKEVIIDFDSAYELEVPKGIRIDNDLKRFFKLIQGKGYRLIVIKGLTFQIRDSYNVPSSDTIGQKDVLSLPYNIEKKLISLMEKCSIHSQKNPIAK